ncbi:MAG: inner membrane-spanning protein YciB [Pseudomonadales bacterium]|jgi:intracellular septation protein
MSQLFDFVPVAVFVIVFFLSDIFYATAALMIGVTAQVLVYLAMKKPLSRELKITFWASMVFGGLTLFFRNETFILWKPTIVNWLLAGVLIGSHFFSTKNALEHMLGSQVTLHQDVWKRLNFGWAAGFLFAGALNLVVAYNFSLEFWVSYKLIGGFALTFLYIAITIGYLAAKGYLNEPDEPGRDGARPEQPRG